MSHVALFLSQQRNQLLNHSKISGFCSRPLTSANPNAPNPTQFPQPTPRLLKFSRLVLLCKSKLLWDLRSFFCCCSLSSYHLLAEFLFNWNSVVFKSLYFFMHEGDNLFVYLNIFASLGHWLGNVSTRVRTLINTNQLSCLCHWSIIATSAIYV